MIFIITLSTFAFITLAVMGIYWLMFRPASAATERLRRMGETTGGGGGAVRAGGVDLSANAASDDSMTALAERMAKPLHRLAPPSAAEAKKLQKMLMQAGYRSPSAPLTFRAVHFCVMMGLPGAVAFG